MAQIRLRLIVTLIQIEQNYNNNIINNNYNYNNNNYNNNNNNNNENNNQNPICPVEHYYRLLKLLIL